MNHKTIIFIDGANFHNSLTRVGYLEKDINWSNLLQALVKQANPKTDFWRAYWYEPASLSDLVLYPSQLKARGSSAGEVEQFRKNCEAWYQQQEERLRKKQQEVYGRIAEEHPRIEFKYVGILRVNPVEQKILGEKGVDIGLALDLADPSIKFDTAIICSGDFDFHPAFQKAKSQLKHIVVAPFVTGDPANFERGAARGLRRTADDVVPIFEKDLNDPEKKYLNDYTVYRPPINMAGRWTSLKANLRQVNENEWQGKIDPEALAKLSVPQGRLTDFLGSIRELKSIGQTRHAAIRDLVKKLMIERNVSAQ